MPASVLVCWPVANGWQQHFKCYIFQDNGAVCSVTQISGSSASYAANVVRPNDPRTSNKAEMMSLLAKETWLPREKT